MDVRCRGDLQVARGRPKGLPYIPKEESEVTKRGRRALGTIACFAALAAIVALAQACGGGSASEDASPTATSPPAAAVGDETPPPGFTPGAGPRGQALFFGGPSEELATFLGISLDQLESELSAEGATPASVAEAHGRTREELKTFFTEQQQAQVSDAVAAGTMSQQDADQMLESFASRIDDVIDGNVPFGGGPGAGGFAPGDGGAGLFIGGPSEELASFLEMSFEELQAELAAEGATLASVAEAHDRTREELKDFYTEQQETQLSEAVVAGDMSQEDADQALEAFASRIDDIIDGNVPIAGGPGAGGFAPGDGGAGLFIGGPSEELASFLDMSFEDLQAELAAASATLASVADAHGRSRDELKTFLTDQLETQTIEAVVAGTISPDDADAMLERLAASIDDIIDGKMLSGGFRPAPTPSGQ